MARQEDRFSYFRTRLVPVLSVAQMQALDRRTISQIGIPAVCLMENAGRAVAEEAIRMLRSRRICCSRTKVCVVCGNGNNGGDGLVAARHLLNQGMKVAVLWVGGLARASAEFGMNYRVARKLRIPFCRLQIQGRRLLRDADLVIDALLGVGLSRPVSGEYRAVVEAVNAVSAPVLAVDVPSGLDATTGCVWGVGVRATATVTLACPKTGLYTAEGPRYAGRIRVADIGIPYSLLHRG